MRNKLMVFALFGALLLGFSTSVFAAGEKPGQVVKNYFVQMSKGEWTAAKKYLASKELQQMITGLEGIYKELPVAEKKKDAMDSFGAQAKLKIVSEKITGNKAVVVFTYVEKKKTKKDKLNLEKIGGVWKIVD